MTWIDVIKEQLAKMRKEGKSPSIGDVTPAAKKEWAEIKSGKHPLYIQGSSKGKQSKGKQNKTQKVSGMSNNLALDHQYCIEQMMKKVHLCKKDVSKIHKFLKTMKIQKGGDCGCSQSGGKKGRRTMKVKGMKGGFVSIVDKETGEYDGAEETDGKEEEVVYNEDS